VKVSYTNSIEHQVVKHIEQAPNKVVLRKDFSQLGSYRQISRVFQSLVEKKKLVKISAGIYAKAYQSKYIDTPLIENGFDNTAREALDRLGVKWEPGSAEQAYNTGKSQQVPANNVVQLKSRLRRKFSHGNRQLKFEGKINAR